MAKFCRTIGEFCLSLFLGVFGSSVAEVPFVRRIDVRNGGMVEVWVGDLVVALVAIGLGAAVSLRLRWRPARWVWVAGVVWLITGLLGGGILWEFAGRDSVISDDRALFWMAYTLPALRTVGYSVGASAVGCTMRQRHSVPVAVGPEESGGARR